MKCFFAVTREKVALIVLALVAFGLRLYRLDYPLMDWHSFRQADTASVTREFVRHNYPIWEPHYHDLGNVQSGLDNLDGYRMVEFPLINYLLAQILRCCPWLDLVVLSRLAAAVASTAGIVAFYYLIKIWMADEKNGRRVAFLAASFWAVMPYAIYYGRTVLPEPFQVVAGVLALLSFSLYLRDERKRYFWWTVWWLAVALLLKPTTVFLGPVFLALACLKYGVGAFRRRDLYLLAALSLMPLVWWRWYILRFPAGIPASSWLLNGNGIRLRPAWWRWLGYERVTKMIFGYVGVLVAAVGVWPTGDHRRRLAQSDILTYVWTASVFAYLVVFATGNVQHDYYQYLLVPVCALLLARGVYTICEQIEVFYTEKSRKIPKHFWYGVLKAGLIVALVLAWRDNQGKFNVNNWQQVRIGRKADQLLPLGALVVAHSAGGDTNFLFQVNRRGWPQGYTIEDEIAAGAQYFVTADGDDLYHFLAERYTIVYEDENGAIIDLTTPSATQSTTVRMSE